MNSPVPYQQIIFPDVDYAGALEYMGRYMPEKRDAEIARLSRAGCPAVTIARLRGAKYELEKKMAPAPSHIEKTVRYEINVNVAGFRIGNPKDFAIRVFTISGVFGLLWLVLVFHVLIGTIIAWALGLIVGGGFAFFFLKMLLVEWRSHSETPARNGAGQGINIDIDINQNVSN